jgi:hemerythrin-like metal-binding protein
LEYTYVHFTNEEIMLTNHNYPELEIHKREHVRLVSQVVELKQKYEAGELMITLSVMDFLKDWLANHIMGFDQKYSPFIKE